MHNKYIIRIILNICILIPMVYMRNGIALTVVEPANILL